MTDIEVAYYDSTWNDLSDYVTQFAVSETGIQKVSSAMVNFRTTARTNIQSFLTNPYRLMRIRADNGGWQTLFYGYCNKPYLKTVTGTISEKVKMSLDLKSFSSRLAADTITYDYYKLQSAITPYTTASITFREMLNDMFLSPDSGVDTGFVLSCTDASVDGAIDAVGNWENQTVFEAVRLTAEHLGLDGYYNLASEIASPNVHLYPFSKASSYALTAPFIGEPTWEGGALDDIGNMIFLEGGVDSGIPSDTDRWTEYGYVKYSPAAWSATSTYGSVTISDVTNTNLDIYAVGGKAVKFYVNNGTNGYIYAILDISKTAETSVDCLNRCSSLVISLYPNVNVSGMALIITLEDSSGNKIDYACIQESKSAQVSFYDGGEAFCVSIPVGSDCVINETPTTNFFFDLIEQANDTKSKAFGNKYYYRSGYSTFDWEHVKKVHINAARFQYGGDTVSSWSFEVDGLQFVGGQKIDFSNTLNPPLSDVTSIGTYGIHVYKHTDASVSSLEQAAAEKARLLANLAYPIDTLTVKKIAPTTLLHPSNVVTTNSVDYRIAQINYEWRSKNKQLNAEYRLIEKTSPLPPIWTEQNELRYLIK